MLIAGNWKLNCNIDEAINLSSSIVEHLANKKLNCDVALFPPYICLDNVRKALKNSNVRLGAQDCSIFISGAYTGDVSANMLFDTGCKYVIVGHSERRVGKLESNNDVLLKANNAIESGLIPIICVGENAKDRDDGQALEVIKKQLDESVPKNINKNNCVIAYEPIWAIGSGKTATLAQIEEMAKEIHTIVGNFYQHFSQLRITVLYGGSVKPDNAKEILGLPSVDGLLIGGASLVPKNMEQILSFC